MACCAICIDTIKHKGGGLLKASNVKAVHPVGGYYSPELWISGSGLLKYTLTPFHVSMCHESTTRTAHASTHELRNLYSQFSSMFHRIQKKQTSFVSFHIFSTSDTEMETGLFRTVLSDTDRCQNLFLHFPFLLPLCCALCALQHYDIYLCKHRVLPLVTIRSLSRKMFCISCSFQISAVN